MGKTDSISIGNSGEYFVAAELERNGFTAAIPMSGTADFDILAIHKKTHRQIAIQVKTNHTKARTWTLSEKNEALRGSNLYYVFVTLNDLAAPEYFIVHSHAVAESICQSHFNWVKKKKEDGTFQKNTSIRKFSFDLHAFNPFHLKAEDFKNNWEALSHQFNELTWLTNALKGDSFGNWITDPTADGSYEKPFQLPYVDYDENIDVFASHVRLFAESHPELSLSSYRKILSDNNIEIASIKQADVSKLDGQCICAMIYANVLAEKFCEGAILASCKDQTFTNWLSRLHDIDTKKQINTLL